jgi:hypothetical protein
MTAGERGGKERRCRSPDCVGTGSDRRYIGRKAVADLRFERGKDPHVRPTCGAPALQMEAK